MDLLPIRLAVKFGPWLLLEATLLSRDEPEPEELVTNTAVRMGFAVEPVDELDTRLEPMEDD